jgi:glycosyltransferase involved in cell wall biosynthesis
MDMTSKGSRAWADVWHSPLWSLPEFGGERRPLQFVTVYDLIAVLFPAYFVGNPEPVRRLERDLKMFHRDQYFLCISEATRRDLCNHCPGIDPAKAFVTPLAASRAFYRCSDGVVLRGIRRKFGIPEGGRYLLSVATIEPRKNVVAIVRAFCWLVMERGMDELYLVLVGAQGWDSGAVSREVREAPERVRERIIATGYVSDGELAPLYSGAEAFVYPSFYEGFGLPPLEAMQCGTPVITSNVSSLPEVVGDAGILVDPGDQGAICGAIEGLLGDGEMAAGLREKGLRRAAEFSWKACAARTLDAYEAGLGRVRRA